MRFMKMSSIHEYILKTQTDERDEIFKEILKRAKEELEHIRQLDKQIVELVINEQIAEEIKSSNLINFNFKRQLH